MSVTVGDEQHALIFFALYSMIGVVLGVVVFAVFAFRGARRPQFRHLGVMPRFGATVGISIAVVISYMAWASAYRGFYHLEVDDEVLRLHYVMPSQVKVFLKSAVTSVEKRVQSWRGGRYHIDLVTDGGIFSSAGMYRMQFDAAWQGLSVALPAP